MNRILKKRMWLAGASLLAIVLGSGDANAQVINSGSFILPARGWYDFTVAGAQGGNGGELGAVVGGELFFNAGAILSVVVGGVGERAYSIANGYGGGGGGGSFVFGSGNRYLPQAVVAVAIFSTSVVVRLTIPESEMAAAKAGITGAGVGAALEQGV